MADEALRDFLAASTLSAGIDNITLSIAVGDGSVFPSSGTFDIRIDDEIIPITSVSGNTLTATSRGGGTPATTAASHSSGAAVRQVLTKRGLEKTLQVVKCKIYHSTTQSVDSATDTALNLNSEDSDPHGFHDTVTNNTRITVPTGMGGEYLVTAFTKCEPHATGDRYMYLRKGGTTNLRGASTADSGSASRDSRTNINVVVTLAAGEYLELMVYQNSGVARNYGDASAVEKQTSISLVKVG